MNKLHKKICLQNNYDNDTKGVIRSCKLKDRQSNDQRKKGKRINNDLQNITQRTKVEPHEPHKTPWWNWVSPEEQAVHYWPVVFFFVNNSLISHELETNGIVITTQNISVVICDTKNISVVICDTNSISVVMCDTRTYPWLCMTQRTYPWLCMTQRTYPWLCVTQEHICGYL